MTRSPARLTGEFPGIEKRGGIRRWHVIMDTWVDGHRESRRTHSTHLTLRGARREFRKTPPVKEAPLPGGPHKHWVDRAGFVRCTTGEHPVRTPFDPFDRSRP